MTQEFETLVVRRPTLIGKKPPTPGAVPQEILLVGREAGEELESTQELLTPMQRLDVDRDPNTVATILSMPFSLIEPTANMVPAFDGDAWGIASIGADQYDENAGTGVTVAVLDTGIDRRHETFKNWINERIVEKDFTGEGNGDRNGHGTHCAGTICGGDVDGTRIGIARGISKLAVGKVLGSSGGSTQAIYEALTWAATEQGAHIISMSLGIDFVAYRNRLVENDVDPDEATSLALSAYRENIRFFDDLSNFYMTTTTPQTPLLIAATGNESSHPDVRISAAPPSAARDILSVGAIDENLDLAPFSNVDPLIVAPGVGIRSAQAGGGLVDKNGTSMATPHVTGVAALVASQMITEENYSAAQLKDKVLANALQIKKLSRREAGVGLVQAP